MCAENGENDKYLMTFQNLLARIPKWNATIIEDECKRIVERSGCNYLEDLITCVHIIQLKVLTCVRVGNKQKKIDISIPKLENFVHKIYINSARKCYSNVYLFENTSTPLLKQKNNRELEQIIQECIITTIRESIPTEEIIRAYMDETIEQEEEVTIEDVKKEDLEPKIAEPEENIKMETKEEEPEEKPVVPTISNVDNEPVVTKLTFNNYDSVQEDNGTVSNIEAPKNVERLEEIANSRAIQRKLEEEEDDDMDEKIKIHTDNLDLSSLDIFDIDKPNSGGELSLGDIEVLE
tara:strand:+ start:658 stop:1536 length:879 start_codon:yes stop_codon:yes gene_type:complete